MSPSCIFSLPGMPLGYMVIDALHALDLGVSQHALGNTLWELVNSGFFPGDTQASRVKALWAKLTTHYKEHKTPNRIQALTVEMLKMAGKGPKLRGKGTDTRGSLPSEWRVPQTCTSTPGPCAASLCISAWSASWASMYSCQ